MNIYDCNHATKFDRANVNLDVQLTTDCMATIVNEPIYAGARDKKEKDDRLPLHLACAHQAPADVVAALLAAHRDGEAGWVGRGLWRVVILSVVCFALLFAGRGGRR